MLDELVTPESAREQYGVVVDTARMEVDTAATEKLRQELVANGS